MPYRLPLFPLPVVLFPGVPIPLHVFEPRYQRLLADCLAGDRRFGIAPAGTTSEAPDPGAVGCVAEIRVNQPLPDGRSNIVVLGVARFRVVQRLTEEDVPYHVALVDELKDDPGSEPPAEAVGELRRLFVPYVAALRELQDIESEGLELPADAAGLSFQVAGAIECDAAIKQQLLGERSIAHRVALLLDLLPALTRRVEAALRVHRRAHTNGKGAGHPDILAG